MSVSKLKLVSSGGEILEVFLFQIKQIYCFIKVDEDVAVKSGLIKNMIEGSIFFLINFKIIKKTREMRRLFPFRT